MPGNFGAQGKGDASAYLEGVIEEAVDYGLDFLQLAAQNVANRPPGNKPVSQKDQRAEWALAMLDPTQLKLAIEARANLVGLENAAAEFLEWDAKHRKMGPAPEPLPPIEPPMPDPSVMPPPDMPMNGATNGY